MLSQMNEIFGAGLTSIETQRSHRGLQGSLKSSYLALDEASRFLHVMAKAPVVLNCPVTGEAQGGYAARQRSGNGAAAAYVDPEDLARFEGEGGRGVPEAARPVLKKPANLGIAEPKHDL